jgi:hypothetical protein
LKNNINVIESINFLIDEFGNEYRIPNYCINDPYFEKNLLDLEKEINLQVIY